MSAQDKKIYQAIKEFAKKQMNSYSKYEFSRELWQKCCDYGILSMLTPAKAGGMAQSYGSVLKVAKYIGEWVEDTGFVFTINNSLIVSSFLLPKYANEEMIAEFYPDLYNGKLIACYAITEPDSGSDAFKMQTTYEVKEDCIILNGTKTYISNATIADVYAVVAKNENEEYSIFMVRADDEGVSIGKEIEKMGLETCPMGELVLCNCKIPKNRVIGKLGQGMQMSNMTLDFERCCSFSSHLGTMQRVMKECITYVNSRTEFGKKIGSYQLIREKIAKIKIAVELGETLLHKIITMKDAGRNTYLESAIFKYYIGEEYCKTVIEALQIFGAYGYSKEGEIEHEVRNALASKIYSGTSEIQIDVIARMLGVKG